MMQAARTPAKHVRRKFVWDSGLLAILGLALVVATATRVEAQTPAQELAPSSIAPTASAAPASPRTPSPDAVSGSNEYVIGSDDVLSILFWKDKDLSAPEVTVRPDGKVTLPLLNDVQASGLTPDQLRDAIKDAAQKYVEDPNPTVIVKEIKSRRVFITGQVDKPGPYLLKGSTTILQLIAIAGGLRDFADAKNISVVRSEGGQQVVYAFNYRDVLKMKNLSQNIELKSGDTVLVP